MISYQPELLGIFQRVFDEIWQELEPAPPHHAHDERRSELARRIILAHRRGLKLDHIKAKVLGEMKGGTA